MPNGLRIAAERCSGCGRCVAACRKGIYSLEASEGRKFAVRMGVERCSHCLECRRECLMEAISVRMLPGGDP